MKIATNLHYICTCRKINSNACMHRQICDERKTFILAFFLFVYSMFVWLFNLFPAYTYIYTSHKCIEISINVRMLFYFLFPLTNWSIEC